MSDVAPWDGPNLIPLDVRARALYDACPTVKPSWDQLGDTTRDVWREKVPAQDFGDIA